MRKGILEGKEAIYGINIGCTVINSNEVSGLAASLGKINGNNFIHGITFASITETKNLWGINVSLLYMKTQILQGLTLSGYNNITHEQRGITIGILNVAENLHGIQIGLLNYAGNNACPFQLLPFINFHN